MKILHITPSTNGYEEVTLIANAVSKKNTLAVIEKNGERFFTGGFLINDTPAIRNVLDNIPKDKQYDFVKEFKMDPFASLYLEHDEEKLRPSFWFMRDNHTFKKLEGNNAEEVKNHAIQVAKENPCGMVCPVTILHGGVELRRVGEAAHVDKYGNVDLSEWYNAIMKEYCVRNYKNNEPVNNV